VLSPLIAVVVLVATTIQAWSSAVELGRANRAAVDWMNAEDDLIAGEPRLRRRRARRLLVAERDRDMHREIRRVTWTLGSWVALMAAAVATLLDQVT
jgi:hypothetical protein